MFWKKLVQLSPVPERSILINKSSLFGFCGPCALATFNKFDNIAFQPSVGIEFLLLPS